MKMGTVNELTGQDRALLKNIDNLKRTIRNAEDEIEGTVDLLSEKGKAEHERRGRA